MALPREEPPVQDPRLRTMESVERESRPGVEPETFSPLGLGFVLMAAIFMMMGGAFHFIQGLAAVLDDGFFDDRADYAYDFDLTTWGWIHIVGGIIVALAGVALLSGAVWARILALVIASASMIASFVYIPYYPVWSILIIAFNIGVIWALATYGRHLGEMQS